MHVWVADLDIPPGQGNLLSTGERARARRFPRARDAQRWSRAREVLRSLLGGYLQSDPRTLRFVTGTHGKPELEGHPRGVHFNLSHSGAVAVYAVAATQPVGVDVELAGRDIDVLAVAERALGATVRARLDALDPDVREREFLREWVRHEAATKCLGVGLAGGDSPVDAHRPWVSGLDLGPRWTAAGWVAAVAAMEEPGEVSRREWRG